MTRLAKYVLRGWSKLLTHLVVLDVTVAVAAELESQTALDPSETHLGTAAALWEDLHSSCLVNQSNNTATLHKVFRNTVKLQIVKHLF